MSWIFLDSGHERKELADHPKTANKVVEEVNKATLDEVKNVDKKVRRKMNVIDDDLILDSYTPDFYIT